MQTIGDRLREVRTKKKMKQAELSGLSKVPQSAISFIENGQRLNPTIQTLNALEEALGLRHGWLSAGDAPEAKPARRRKSA